MPPLSADADKGDQEPVVVAGETGHGFWQEGVQALRAEGENRPSRPSHVVAFRKAQKAHNPDDCERWEEASRADTLDSIGHSPRTAHIAMASVPRRLTPRECERLQAFPDDWTRYGIAENGTEYELSDSARYRQMGNAVTVNVVEWIGRRILAAHERTS